MSTTAVGPIVSFTLPATIDDSLPVHIIAAGGAAFRV